MFHDKHWTYTVLSACQLPSSISCSRHVIAWPAHEPPHATLPWLHSTLHVNISNRSSSWELSASDSVITGRVMPVNRAVTCSTSYHYYPYPDVHKLVILITSLLFVNSLLNRWHQCSLNCQKNIPISSTYVKIKHTYLKYPLKFNNVSATLKKDCLLLF